MSEWISVKDRLPERYQKVIFYRKDEFLDEVECGDFEYHWDLSNVQYWMPLPKPPEVRE